MTLTISIITQTCRTAGVQFLKFVITRETCVRLFVKSYTKNRAASFWEALDSTFGIFKGHSFTLFMFGNAFVCVGCPLGGRYVLRQHPNREVRARMNASLQDCSLGSRVGSLFYYSVFGPAWGWASAAVLPNQSCYDGTEFFHCLIDNKKPVVGYTKRCSNSSPSNLRPSIKAPI